MLEKIREGSQKAWVKYFIFAIVISFVFAGGFSVTSLLGDPNAAAIVNGKSVSRVDFQRAYANVKATQADLYKANVKTEEDERDFQENVLQQLITETVTNQSIEKMGLRLSQTTLKNIIQSEPNYQVDGKYSAALVDQTMTRAGMTKESFKKYYENRQTRTQLSSGLFQTDFALAGEMEKGYALETQKRSGQFIKIDYDAFQSGITNTDEEISQYYADNIESFRIEEKVAIDYLELSVDKLQTQQNPTEEEINLFYQDNLTRYKTDEQRQYAHILILSNDDDSVALAKANELSEKISAGADFAELAKKASDDAATKESGGDLGVLLAGALDEASEESVKSLKSIGDVTPPVKLEFGYQILKLTDIIDGTTKSLAEVKDELIPELSKQLAEEAFYAKSEVLKEKAFEFADSLVEAATATELTIESSPLFGRNSMKGLFANQDVKNVAFSSDLIDGRLNSSAIEISDKHLVVLRVTEHKPSEVQPLESVKDRISKALIKDKSKKTVADLAHSILVKLNVAESVDELLTTNNLEIESLSNIDRNTSGQLSYAAKAKFFKMAKPQIEKPTVDLVDDFQSYTVLVLNSVENGSWNDADQVKKTQNENYLKAYFASAGFEAFKNNLRNNAEVTRNLNNLSQ